MDRQYLMYPLASEILVELFSGCGLRVIRNNLPEDARFISVHFDHQRDSFLIVYEHESFPITPEGFILPMGEMECWIEGVVVVEEEENE